MNKTTNDITKNTECKRLRISVPLSDTDAISWWGAQSNGSISMRRLIALWIEHNGVTDVAASARGLYDDEKSKKRGPYLKNGDRPVITTDSISKVEPVVRDADIPVIAPLHMNQPTIATVQPLTVTTVSQTEDIVNIRDTALSPTIEHSNDADSNEYTDDDGFIDPSQFL